MPNDTYVLKLFTFFHKLISPSQENAPITSAQVCLLINIVKNTSNKPHRTDNVSGKYQINLRQGRINPIDVSM